MNGIRRMMMMVATVDGYGPNIVVNGDFSSGGTGWEQYGAGGWTYPNGTALCFLDPPNGSYLCQNIGAIEGRTYRVRYSIKVAPNQIYDGLALTIGNPTLNRTPYVKEVNTYESIFTATDNSGYIFFWFNGDTITLDDISVQESSVILPTDKMAITFPGGASYGTFPVEIWSKFPTSGGSFTIEHWVKTAATPGQRTLLTFARTSDGFFTGLYAADFFGEFGYTGAYLEQPLAVGWRHTAYTHNSVSSIQQLIIDGAVVEQGNVAGWTRPSDPLTSPLLGTRLPNNEVFIGDFDIIRVWNIARTAAQLNADKYTVFPAGTPGLVAQYLINEGSGSTLFDTSGNGYDIVLTGSVAWNPDTDSPVNKNLVT